MNPRERVLAVLVGSVLVLAALWAGVRYGVVHRWQALEDDIRAQQRRVADLRAELNVARGAVARWNRLRPLSRNVDRAEDSFRAKISQLIERHGLAGDFTVNVLSPRTISVDRDTSFTEVRLSIKTSGTLQQFMGFTCDFYLDPDLSLARLDRVSLVAEERARRTEQSADARRGRRARTTGGRDSGPDYGPEGPNLSMTITATTLVLPDLRGIEVASGAEATEPDESVSGRLPSPAEEYAKVWDQNIFALYQPPPPVVAARPTEEDPPPVVVPDEQPAPTAPPKPRPNKSVVGRASVDGKLVVHVRDDDNWSSPLEKVFINDPIDDGTLVLVHPHGIVVQVEEAGRQGPRWEYYFYPRNASGARFRDRVRLEPGLYPEIQRELEQAFE
jgi:hypothetical protein